MAELNYTSEICQKLSALLKANRFPHAILIECADEEAGASAARFASKMLVCENKDMAPCGVCSACKKAQAGSHPDIAEYSGGNAPRSFKVDWVREAIRSAYVMPNEADSKVFVFLKTQTMSDSAQNAVLKVLEEPPSYVKFILVCNSKTNMLETILSRCVVFSLDSDAQTDLPEKTQTAVRSMVNGITAPEEYTLIKEAGTFEKDKDLLREVISELINVFRDAAFIKGGGRASLSRVPDASEKAAASLTMPSILKVMDVLYEVESAMARNINYNLLLTAMCSRLRGACVR